MTTITNPDLMPIILDSAQTRLLREAHDAANRANVSGTEGAMLTYRAVQRGWYMGRRGLDTRDARALRENGLIKPVIEDGSLTRWALTEAGVAALERHEPYFAEIRAKLASDHRQERYTILITRSLAGLRTVPEDLYAGLAKALDSMSGASYADFLKWAESHPPTPKAGQ